jgi:hypothetical protein
VAGARRRYLLAVPILNRIGVARIGVSRLPKSGERLLENQTIGV